MGIFSFLKTRKPRQFEYHPRYWDPRKEALQERIRQIQEDIAVEKGAPPPPGYLMRKGFIRDTSKLRHKHNRSSNIRLAIIISILFLLFYLFFYR